MSGGIDAHTSRARVFALRGRHQTRPLKEPTLGGPLVFSSPVKVCIALVCIWSGANALHGQDRSHPPAVPQAAEMLRAVVTILVQRADGSAQGSGVVVDPNGVIATAAHVIAGAISARVRLASGDVLTVEGVIDTDPERDIALLRVAGFQLATARLGNSDSLRLGQRLLAISTPIGLETTVADGLLSSIRTDSTGRLLQISIPVSHGSSGGPVFTDQGLVVGLVVSGVRGDVAQGINFAVPINYVRGKLSLAATKTPVPLSESARMLVGVPTGPVSSNAPDTVNRALDFDWRSLAGVQILSEISEDRGIKTRSYVRYSMTTDPAGRPVFARQVESTTRVRANVLRSDDAFTDEGRTELTLLSGSNIINESTRRTAFANGAKGGSAELHIEGGRFSLASDGQVTSGATSKGVLSSSMAFAAIAALPDSLPPTVFVWVLKPNGLVEPIRFEFGGTKEVQVRVAKPGSNCDDAYPALTDSLLLAVEGEVVIDASSRRFAVLASRPHLNVTPAEVKCIVLPRRGASTGPRDR